MKKFVYTVVFFFLLHFAFAQDEPQGAAKLKEKMVEYIQTKLSMNRDEA